MVFPVLTEATFPPAFSIIANMLWRSLLDLDHSNKMVKGKHTAHVRDGVISYIKSMERPAAHVSPSFPPLNCL